MQSTNIFDFLKQRGYIHQSTNEKAVKDLFASEKVTIYQGFDPTSDSLQIGNFLGVMTMSRLQKAGHQPIFLLGAFTAIVGDPSGRTKERPLLSFEELEKNGQAIKKQVENMGLLDFSGGKALLLSNADWLDADLKTYLREVSRHISVSQLLSHETFKKRLKSQTHLSVMELLYSTLQAWDFLHLFQNFNCKVQMGGADQWTNMLDGVDLIQNSLHQKAHCFTLPLLTDSKGKKLGKTAANKKVWLDPNKTSPFEFYQYFRNIEDEKTPQLLRLLTFLEDSEIKDLEKANTSQARLQRQEKLAFEITKIVHGDGEAQKAQKAAKSVFLPANNGGRQARAGISRLEFSEKEAKDLLDLLVKCGLTASRSSGKRLIEQKGVRINGEIVADRDFEIKSRKEYLINIGKNAIIVELKP